MKMDDKKKPGVDTMDSDMPMHVKAKMDVLHALRNLAQEMMAEHMDEGEDGAVMAHVDVKDVMPSELPDGNEKQSRLDHMTKDLNDSDSEDNYAESLESQDKGEDEDLLAKLKQHMSKKA